MALSTMALSTEQYFKIFMAAREQARVFMVLREFTHKKTSTAATTNFSEVMCEDEQSAQH